MTDLHGMGGRCQLSGRVPERRLGPPTGGLGLPPLEVRGRNQPSGWAQNEMTAISLQMARSRAGHLPWFDLWAPGGC